MPAIPKLVLVGEQPRGTIPLSRISSHDTMQSTLQLAHKAAADKATPPAPVLITGETGTGKEVMARAIHHASTRQNAPIVGFNCSGVPDGLIESELFGYGRGAFTGANNGGKKGLIEEADRGTLFLDEIGDMPIAAQAKLLRVLQDQMVRRLGKNQSVKVDLRIIAATNRNLTEAIKRGEFRQDLFYRLNVIEIALPPLRERPEDVTALAKQFLINWAEKGQKVIEGFTDAAREALRRHPWPGNIRELENVVRHAVVMADDGGVIGTEHLPRLQSSSSAPAAPETGEADLRTLQEVMTEHVRKVLEYTHDNRTEAAEILGITTTTLRGHAGPSSSYRRSQPKSAQPS